MIRLFKKYEDLIGSFSKDQAGNMFTAVLGVVAIVGVLSVSVYSLLSGPIKTAAVVTAKSKATNQMITGAQVLMAMAADDDGDVVVEAPEYKAPGGDPAPTGGGLIPDNAGSAKIDPWGVAYGYCVWDHGPDNDATGDNRLDGLAAAYDAELVIALISAGPNRTFETTCAASGGTQITETGDDIIERYSFSEAQSIAGGVWTIVDASNIEYDQNIAVGGDARIDNDLIIGDGDPGVGNLSVGNNVNVTGSVSGALGSFTSVDIDGGTIDGTTIGGTTPAAGTFTNGTIATADINGGNIDGTVIGASSAAAGTFTNGTIATADINGGNIDGTVIGASSAAAGTFTTINASTGNFTDITVTDTGMVSNLTAQYLGCGTGATCPEGVSQDAAFFRNATYIDAGTLDPTHMPPFDGDATAADSLGANYTITVTGLQGRDVVTTAPDANDLLGWNGTAWAPLSITVDGAGGDITITESDPNVNNLGNVNDFDSSACGNGEIPKYDGSDWACATDAGGFANPATEDLDMNGYDILDVNSIQITSDFRYKKQIEPMRQMLKRVTQIQPVTFFWNDWAKSKGRYDSDKHLGLIAQDVEAMFPEAVITSKDGHKGIDYPALSAVMLQAIRELAVQNQALQGQINDLKRQSHQ